MLDHLVNLSDADFVDLDEMDASSTASASIRAINVLDELEARPASPTEQDAARMAFAALTNPKASEQEKKTLVLSLRAPAAVQHLSDMLSEYDWDFIRQAKELRGYVVARLLEETKSPDPRIRLRALELVGKVTEVAAFTERSEVVHKNANESDITERLRSKLQSLLPKVVEVQDANPKGA